jgi:glycosyltransferase involved in cell wall biosynthesis
MSKAVISKSEGRVPFIVAAESALTERRSMRVLHIHSGNLYGGVESMLLTQARQRDLCPSMATSFALCFKGRFSEELERANSPLHWLGEARIRQPLSVRRARRNLRELLQRESFDVAVIHSSWSQAIFGAVVRAAAVPLAFYLHGAANGRHWLERWAKRTPPDMALCNSRFTALTLPEMYAGLASEVVYCPVAAPEQDYSAAERAQTRAELQTPADATVIIQVSRMEALKGHFQHLEALSLLRDSPDWVCWQVGGAQRPDEIRYLAELKKAATRLGIAERIRFLNQRTDVARLLAAADIFCQPNTAPDAFGIAFIEALYAQLPVVTTAIGGALEIIDDSCGLLVPPGDAIALSASLRRLIQDRTLRAQLGMAGPARARQLCDPGARMTQLYEALNRISAASISRRNR